MSTLQSFNILETHSAVRPTQYLYSNSSPNCVLRLLETDFHIPESHSQRTLRSRSKKINKESAENAEGIVDSADSDSDLVEITTCEASIFLLCGTTKFTVLRTQYVPCSVVSTAHLPAPAPVLFLVLFPQSFVTVVQFHEASLNVGGGDLRGGIERIARTDEQRRIFSRFE